MQENWRARGWKEDRWIECPNRLFYLKEFRVLPLDGNGLVSCLVILITQRMPGRARELTGKTSMSGIFMVGRRSWSLQSFRFKNVRPLQLARMAESVLIPDSSRNS